MIPSRYLTRRRMLQLALTGAVGLSALRARAADAADPLAPPDSAAAGQGMAPFGGQRWLEMLNTHTGESLSLAYRDASGFNAQSLSQLNWLLRDFRVGEQTQMDAPLFDQLADLALAAGVEPRFEIISGYRSARTNASLAEAGHGVATHSLHIEGRAIDVRLRGVDCASLRDLALAMQRGGVGYYRVSNFVHVDTGRVRSWSG